VQCVQQSSRQSRAEQRSGDIVSFLSFFLSFFPNDHSGRSRIALGHPRCSDSRKLPPKLRLGLRLLPTTYCYLLLPLPLPLQLPLQLLPTPASAPPPPWAGQGVLLTGDLRWERPGNLYIELGLGFAVFLVFRPLHAHLPMSKADASRSPPYTPTRARRSAAAESWCPAESPWVEQFNLMREGQILPSCAERDAGCGCRCTSKSKSKSKSTDRGKGGGWVLDWSAAQLSPPSTVQYLYGICTVSIVLHAECSSCSSHHSLPEFQADPK
jgi:hypothetical protein